MSDDAAAAVAERVLGAAIGALELVSIAIGDRLGYYAALAGAGPLDARALAAATGTDLRYAAEWLEQQAVAGFVEVELAGERESRRYRCADGVAEVLADPDAPSAAAPLARQVAAAGGNVLGIVAGARSGTGMPWAAMGSEMRESQADLNRPGFLGPLATEWLPAVPEVHTRLTAGPSRVADVGCGEAWSSIGIAAAYPAATVDAFDLDGPSVERARRHVAQAGLESRVRVREQDVTALDDGTYDVATLFECLHDLAFPVEVLAGLRARLAPGGVVLVADERVEPAFAAPGGEVERLMYGFSVGVCLPDSMSTPGSARTGTVLRAPALRGMAAAAGYSRVTWPGVRHDTWRFAVLHP